MSLNVISASRAPLLLGLAALLLLALLAHRDSPLGPRTAGAAIFMPANPGDLLDAVDTANTNGQPDVINLGGGTFTLTAQLVIADDDATGDGNALTISNGTLQRDTASVDQHRILFVLGGAILILEDVTVTGGDVMGEGGGIYNDGGSLTVTAGSSVSGNSALSLGGGIYNTNAGSVTITDASSVSGNSAGVNGGGIYNFAGGRVEVSGASVIGGDTEAEGNNATFLGGGILNTSGGSVTITDATLAHNMATNVASSGGGIHNEGGGSVTLLRSTVGPGNSANSGGGIFNSSLLNVYNSTVSGNAAVNGGAGIYNRGASALLGNSTVFGNTDGAGLVAGLDSVVALGNTIVAGNTGGNCIVFGTLTSSGNNLYSDESCSPVAGDIVDATAADDIGPLADNGGPTETHALDPESQAVDAGDAGICALGPIANEDQRGVARPQGAQCDIGAFELEPAGDPHRRSGGDDDGDDPHRRSGGGGGHRR